MTKRELKEKTQDAVEETKVALQMVYDAHNNGQKKKLLKDENVSRLFKRYGVEVDE